jgi:hypothetical protein
MVKVLEHGILHADMGVFRRLTAVVGLPLLLLFNPANPLSAAGSVSVHGLTLRATPIADVGGRVSFSLSAHIWPGPATASIRYVSPHHGFTGKMYWDVGCGCFRVAVPLGRAVHPLETAHAWATLRFKSGSATAATTFQIRGLAPGGHTYAPGGTPILRGWVADPAPRHGENEQYCAWVHASDMYGMSGIPVRVVIHYAPKAQTLSAGKTDANGVACTQRSIDSAVPVGGTIKVDIFAGRMHTGASFTVRS